MNVKWILTYFIFSLLAVDGLSQQHMQIDPNNLQGIIPSDRLKNLNNKILIWNAYSKDIAILLSDDKKSWDTLSINHTNGLLLSASVKTARIFTESTFYEMNLIQNSAYLIFWDRNKKIWSFKKYPQ